MKNEIIVLNKRNLNKIMTIKINNKKCNILKKEGFLYIIELYMNKKYSKFSNVIKSLSAKNKHEFIKFLFRKKITISDIDKNSILVYTVFDK